MLLFLFLSTNHFTKSMALGACRPSWLSDDGKGIGSSAFKHILRTWLFALAKVNFPLELLGRHEPLACHVSIRLVSSITTQPSRRFQQSVLRFLEASTSSFCLVSAMFVKPWSRHLTSWNDRQLTEPVHDIFVVFDESIRIGRRQLLFDFARPNLVVLEERTCRRDCRQV